MGNLDQAVEALEGYLALDAEGEHAATVNIRIENLKKRMPEDEAQLPAKPEQASEKPEEAPAESPEPAAPQPAEPSEPDRTWAYVTLAGAGVFAAGAAVTGIMAQGEHDDLENSCKPYCNGSQTSRGKNLALVSTILTGVAVVGAAGGLYLWMSADGGREAPVASVVPRLDLDVGGDRVRASATFRF
jgi:hypothetical protein